MNVGVTATADGLTRPQELVLASLLSDLRTDDVDWLLHGCCIGGDEQLAVRARRLGYLLYGLPGRGLLDPARSLLLNDRLDPVPTTKTPELTRNRHIVAAVGVLLAGPSGFVEKQRSGTWATIRYAKAARLPVIIVYPDGTQKHGVCGNLRSGLDPKPARSDTASGIVILAMEITPTKEATMIDPLIDLRAEVAKRREDLRIARKHEAEASARPWTDENCRAWRRTVRWTNDRAEAHRLVQVRLIAAVGSRS